MGAVPEREAVEPDPSAAAGSAPTASSAALLACLGSEPAAVAETHISVLVFVGDRVYKARKPVKTPFLDFSTRDLRLADCRREVALNRRLAPDVYLGVLDICDQAGQALDHVVVMRRLPAQLRLAALVTDPSCDEGQVVAVARRVAVFHARAERSAEIDAAGRAAHLRMLWTSNLEELATFVGRFVSAELVNRLRELALGYLDGRSELFAQRVAQGQMVDGHGDLLAQDIFCLPDGPRILDCIEFDPRFRWGDVLYDISFLAMDLEHLGRSDLARRFLAAYREFAAENHPDSLADWHIGYRALVRAKIACIRAADGQPGGAQEATSLLGIAERHLLDCQVSLLLVGGLPGTGKSTLAGALGKLLGWVVLRSDTVREELDIARGCGVGPSSPGEGRYSSARRAEVYRELMRRAGLAVSRGESVIMDATWLDPQVRSLARELAGKNHAVFQQLRCELDLGMAGARIQSRAASGADPSQATPEVMEYLATSTAGRWDDAVVIDTSGTPQDVIARAVAALELVHRAPSATRSRLSVPHPSEDLT